MLLCCYIFWYMRLGDMGRRLVDQGPVWGYGLGTVINLIIRPLYLAIVWLSRLANQISRSYRATNYVVRYCNDYVRVYTGNYIVTIFLST